jgi:hypothetical protein
MNEKILARRVIAMELDATSELTFLEKRARQSKTNDAFNSLREAFCNIDHETVAIVSTRIVRRSDGAIGVEHMHAGTVEQCHAIIEYAETLPRAQAEAEEADDASTAELRAKVEKCLAEGDPLGAMLHILSPR